jgi:hypothetical protein
MHKINVYPGREEPLNEIEKEKPDNFEASNKKILTDIMWEKVRQYIKTLPLHKQIELNGKIMRNDYNLSEWSR